MKNSYFILMILSFAFFGCKKTEPVPPVTAADFIDPLFFGYMQMNYDTNNDFVFQQEEIAAVKELDLAKENYIVNLKGLEKFTELELLRVKGLKLQTKNLKISNGKLKKLYCGEIGLTDLDVSDLTQLELLSCHENNLTILDLNNNPNLRNLYCQNNTSLNNINIRDCLKLTFLWVEGCPLNSLDLSNNPDLEEIYFTVDRFWELDITNNSNLKVAKIERPWPEYGTFKIYITQAQSEIFKNYADPESPYFKVLYIVK